MNLTVHSEATSNFGPCVVVSTILDFCRPISVNST